VKSNIHAVRFVPPWYLSVVCVVANLQELICVVINKMKYDDLSSYDFEVS